MRKRKIHTALLIAFASPLVPHAFADGAWQGSYSADGQCFCSGEVGAAVASQIVPTPIGGQTVKQVCTRVGQGPELNKDAGLFNYPVYEDPQCGHGPHVASSQTRDEGCMGSLDGAFELCSPKGPEWDLNQAYDVPVNLAAALPARSTEQSDFMSLDRGSSSELDDEAANAEAESVASSSEERDAALENFSGESVTVGGQRYLRARDDITPEGGAAGSRIILDGVVYLRDDENLVISDLYQGDETPAPVAEGPSDETPEADSVEPESATSSEAEESAQRLAETRAEQARQEAKARAESERQQQEQREAQARAESERQQQEQREAQARAAAERQRQARREAQARAESERQQQAQREAQARADLEKDQQARTARLQERRRIAREQAEEEARALAEQESLTAQKAADEKQKQIDEQKLAEKKRLADEALAAENARKESERAAVAEASDKVDSLDSDSSSANLSAAASALRLPPGVRASSREFRYMEALPASYDIGGSGIILEGSGQAMSRFQWLGRLGVADTYREVMVGGGYYFTPESASRMTFVLMAGIENGSFELSDEQRAPGLTVNSADSGLFLGASSRIVINSRFELKAGLGYSSFFEGDATLFGGGYFHLTPRLDILSRFELGDNDSVGLGIRYYY